MCVLITNNGSRDDGVDIEFLLGMGASCCLGSAYIVVESFSFVEDVRHSPLVLK